MIFHPSAAVMGIEVPRNHLSTSRAENWKRGLRYGEMKLTGQGHPKLDQCWSQEPSSESHLPPQQPGSKTGLGSCKGGKSFPPLSSSVPGSRAELTAVIGQLQPPPVHRLTPNSLWSSAPTPGWARLVLLHLTRWVGGCSVSAAPELCWAAACR